MGKTRILHIIKSLGRGGAEMLLPETLSLHNLQNFEFHYIYFLPWKDQMVESIKENGGKVKCFPAKNNFELFRHTRSIINYCRKEKIDLIHCHLPWSGFLGRLVHRQTNIPLIYTEHNIQERYHLATKTLNKYTFGFQSLAIGVSKDVSASIQANIKPQIPVETLLNGVNTKKFCRDEVKGKLIRVKYGIPEDALVVGNIAVFREQKDIPTWVRAMARVIEKEPNIYALLVGAGPKEKEVRNMIQKLGLNDKIFLPGLQTDTISYFSAMDIFMMSSSFEGLPIALLEAMSMNCAIVSTKAGGVVEVVRHEQEGFLCETGDDEALGEAVLKLIRNSETLELFQEKARRRIEESFSLKNMVAELENIYSRIS